MPQLVVASQVKLEPDTETCVPIEGATARTYAPTTVDAGTTLREAATGANSVGSLQATSAVTSIVS